MGVARLRRGDGRLIEMEMTARGGSADEDGALQIFSILHDMAGRLAIEREIEELSARLLELSRGDELTGFQNRRGLLAVGHPACCSSPTARGAASRRSSSTSTTCRS